VWDCANFEVLSEHAIAEIRSLTGKQVHQEEKLQLNEKVSPIGQIPTCFSPDAHVENKDGFWWNYPQKSWLRVSLVRNQVTVLTCPPPSRFEIMPRIGVAARMTRFEWHLIGQGFLQGPVQLAEFGEFPSRRQSNS